MELKGISKEHDSKRPFYKLREETTNDSLVGSNWHGVPINAKV